MKTLFRVAIVGVLGLLGLAILIGVVVSDKDVQEQANKVADDAIEQADKKVDKAVEKMENDVEEKKTESKFSLIEQNAIDKAQNYVDFGGFSEKSLRDQMEFEEFTPEQIDVALKNIEVDYNAESLEKAKSYLDYTSMSKSGLIGQMEFEGFTQSQINYAVDKLGL